MISETAIRASVAVNVARLRRARGWSQGVLAKRLGVSLTHLNRVENGKASVSAELLYTMADCFSVSTDALRQTSENFSEAS